MSITELVVIISLCSIAIFCILMSIGHKATIDQYRTVYFVSKRMFSLYRNSGIQGLVQHRKYFAYILALQTSYIAINSDLVENVMSSLVGAVQSTSIQLSQCIATMYLQNILVVQIMKRGAIAAYKTAKYLINGTIEVCKITLDISMRFIKYVMKNTEKVCEKIQETMEKMAKAGKKMIKGTKELFQKLSDAILDICKKINETGERTLRSLIEFVKKNHKVLGAMLIVGFVFKAAEKMGPESLFSELQDVISDATGFKNSMAEYSDITDTAVESFGIDSVSEVQDLMNRAVIDVVPTTLYSTISSGLNISTSLTNYFQSVTSVLDIIPLPMNFSPTQAAHLFLNAYELIRVFPNMAASLMKDLYGLTPSELRNVYESIGVELSPSFLSDIFGIDECDLGLASNLVPSCWFDSCCIS